MNKDQVKVTIIGAGPAGLFCAYQLVKNGIQVEIFEATSGPCKKFLVAGSSGLNLTHSEELPNFIKRYGKDAETFENYLQDFGPTDLQKWCNDLGVETFVGTSGRVFPTKMSAAAMLKNWREEMMRSNLCEIHFSHKFIGLKDSHTLIIENNSKQFEHKGNLIIFATGGASWKSTGSDGSWLSAFKKLGIETRDFLPMNCGFERSWSREFIEKVDNSPLKNVVIKYEERELRSECMLTTYGIEGTGIYALSNHIRDGIIKNGSASIYLDLRPDSAREQLLEKLSKSRGKNSLSNFLRKSIKLTQVESLLLRELLSKEEFNDMEILVQKLKNLEIRVNKTRPLDEAISTSGGVLMNEVNSDLQLKKHPHIYLCGEMLDWDAPTGGYLLQGCFSTAFRVIKTILKK
jgi:uncharacterized flavoprotein (TIGR03862 family)